MNINDFIDELITELAYRLDSGIPDLKNKQHLSVLSEILTEWGMSELENSLIPILTEEQPPVKSPDDDKYSHKSYGYYVRKGDEDNDEAQLYRKDGDQYISVSKDEYEEKAKEQGELGTKATGVDTKSKTVTPTDTDGDPQTAAAFDPKTKGGKDYLENLPVGDPARQNPIVYPLGGGYYSDTPGGDPMYKKIDESFYIIERQTDVVDTRDTKNVSVVVLGDKEKATAQKKIDAIKKDAQQSDEDSNSVTPLKGEWEEEVLTKMNHPKYKDSILDDNLKEQLSTIVGKMTKGEDLTDEEQAIAKDYIKIVNDKEVKIYIASKKKGDWSQQGYIKAFELGAGKVAREWASGASNKYGVVTGKSGQGAVGKKDPTPAKIIGQEKEIEIGIVDENTVVFNGQTHKKLAVPTIEEVRTKMKQLFPNISSEELKEKASEFVNKIKSKNDSIDELAEISKKTGGKFKIVDIGDTTTPERRNEARKKILDKSIDKFTQLLGDKKDLPDNQKVMETFEKLRDFDGEDMESNPEKQKEYQKLLDELQVNMFNSKDFRDGLSDFAEVKVAMELLSKGNSVYLPADEAFKTADVLVINEISENETDVEFLLISLEFSGGISVKVQGGAAGTSDEKWRQSRFKSNETRRRGNRMLSTYDLFYPKKQTPPDFPPSNEQINEQKAPLEDDKKWMVENGIATEEELTAAEGWANRRVAAVLEKFKHNGVLDCMNDGEKVRFEETMKLYYRNQKISEVLYNNDLDYTNFKNSNQKFSISKGKAVKSESENLDGVENLCYMKIKDDVGFNYTTQKDCTVVKPTNRNPSEIHSSKPVIK
jgi:hypothetical protein